MGWITRGATTLIERTRTSSVQQELVGYGNVIVSALTGNPVTANDGSTVVVAGSWDANINEALPGLTPFVEIPRGTSPMVGNVT